MANKLNVVYFSIIIICLLIGAFVLVLYASQDFDANFSFNKEIRWQDVEIETIYGQNCFYNSGGFFCGAGNPTQRVDLKALRIKIGSIKLENDGFFNQVYKPPRLVGCIDFSDSASNIMDTTNENQFDIAYKSSGDLLEYSNMYESLKWEIKPGEERNYELIAYYSVYSISSSDLAYVENLEIYELPEHQENPFGSYELERYYSDCRNVENKGLEPVAIISVEY